MSDRKALWAALNTCPLAWCAAGAGRCYPPLAVSSAPDPPPGLGPPAPALAPATLLTLTLQEYAARAVPGEEDLWPAIWARMRMLPPRRRRQPSAAGGAP